MAKGNRAGIVAIVIILIMVFDGCYWFNKRFGHKDLRVTIIDVGQGNAALLELPGGACFMLDGGGFSDNTIFDVGERIIAPFLWRKKIMTIDAGADPSQQRPFKWPFVYGQTL